MESPLQFSSGDSVLVDGFEWAKAQALAYVYHHDPLGDWYEAALPGRAAFCMRDVSHQANGAHLLGLASHNYNMLHRFAENITMERDWCSFWEIDQHNRPCPVDYRDDTYFWYNLPANFDVLDCCLRQYHWTANPAYLNDSFFRFFYAKTVNEYVHRWDKDGDGMMEHRPEYGFRGIATYNEEIPHPLIGSDLIASQYAAYRAYAEMMALENRPADAAVYTTRAEQLQAEFERSWWNEKAGRYSSYRFQDGSFCAENEGSTTSFVLYFGLVRELDRLRVSLDDANEQVPKRYVEERAYLPEILFRYGRVEDAANEMKALFSPSLKRREYPELSYSLIGALGTGLMGLTPRASERTLVTQPRLPQSTDWAELNAVPIFETTVSIHHTRQEASRLTLHTGRALNWQAVFPGTHTSLLVDGKAWPAQHSFDPAGEPVSSVLLKINPGETHVVSIR